MPRKTKTQIMHVPIEIYNRYGKEKLQEIIIDFDAGRLIKYAEPRTRTAKDAAIEQGIIEPPEPKNKINNPDLEVQKERVEDGKSDRSVDNNRNDTTCNSDNQATNSRDELKSECMDNGHKQDKNTNNGDNSENREAGTFTKEQTAFLQSQKFKNMMLQGIRNNFRPLYLDAVIITLQEHHGLFVDRDGLIEIMKDVAKSK